jgi:exodeoxyribonuclease V gamma subunit
MTLRAVHGNRADALLAALVQALPPVDPFAPATIVVGNHVVARWLVRELALARGIAAGLDVITFDRFVARTWADDGAGIAALDRAQLAAALASVLADERFVAELPAVAAYLAAAPAPGDRAGPRRVQLADHLAHLAWQYAITRPDWMPAIVVGRAPAELADDPTARWQATLIGEALRRLGGKHAPTPMLPWLRRRAQLAPPALPPLHVFGVSYLQRAQLEALTDLAAATDVTVYLLDACAELWDDVSGRSKPPGDDPLLLQLWGRAMKDTLGALVERTGGDIDDAFAPRTGTTAHDALLADVLARRAPAATGELVAGVHVLACPNPRRELEVVAAKIRAHLDADPQLRAHEIAVWIAGDVERYLAQATSAFEAVGVPCHLVDAPLDDRGRIAEAVLALLELPTCAMTRSDVLRVMTHPAVLAGHPHVDIADWIRWTERLGIVHGADAHAHDGTYLEAHRDKFHWDQGVRRLALGAYMVGLAGSGADDRGAAVIGDIAVAPEEVRPDQQASAATYALLVRSLCADAAWLAAREATLSEWADILVGLVDGYLERTDATARDLERVRAMLAGLAHVDLDGRRVGFREAREHARARLVDARTDRGEPLAAGVTIAPLRVHRAIPFEIACVVGLDEGEFPSGAQPSPLDLRREPRAGDVSPRDRDRHAFFEVVLGTSRALYLSYIAVEAKSGQPLGPSSVVLELADALAPYLGAASSRAALEALTERHPLHRFASAIASPPAISRERWAVRVRDAVRAHLRARGQPIPDEDGMLGLLAHAGLDQLRAELGIVDTLPEARAAAAMRPLSIANLRMFLESPVQAWAQAVLDLDELPDDEVIDHSDEPFHVERPARAILLRDVLAAHLADPDGSLAERYDAIVRQLELRGQFPVGVFGEAARVVDLRTLERWRRELGPVAVGAATRYGFGRIAPSGDTAQLRPPLELELEPGRSVRIVGSTELLLAGSGANARATSVIPMVGSAEKTSRHHLRGALDHAVLAAAGLALHGHDHILLDPKDKALRVSHDPWTQADARAYLAELARDLLDHPHGYLLPLDVLRRSYQGRPPWGNRAPNDPTDGLGYGPIDRRDGLGLPPQLQAIAKRRLGPIAQRMHGDHSFTGGDE